MQMRDWLSGSYLRTCTSSFLTMWAMERKISPKTEVFGRTSLRTSGQKLRSGPPNPGKNKHFGTDMPRGRPQKNFGLKNFGLIFRTLAARGP